ncbi:MAG: LytTR family DNA-binding domain-containing protein [Pseudomonadota bacterium]|uniref:LytTR family DNA-binding domain-containing protein n=1 Tax=Sphingomonas sp. ERG5 TaxID=1381597 RepID=UPI00068D131E|nr:LytTR family DNA-binding domain-containing protein [Sphingomonas sp. ERG5]
MAERRIAVPNPFPGIGRPERTQLLLIALALWVITYVILNLGWLTPPIEHQPERALRRIVTCVAGFALCLAMVPVLQRVSSRPMPQRIGVALVLSSVAYLIHLAVRLAVFHLYRPLWGPLEPEVVASALSGGPGWMIALWATFCLLVLGETTAGAPGRMAMPADQPMNWPDVWSEDAHWRVRVPMENVILFEAERDYVRLHTPSKQYLVRGRLKDWVNRLPEDRYMRVHRSAIVRLEAVEGIRGAGSVWRVRLRNGVEAPVSRSMGRAVRQWLAGRTRADSNAAWLPDVG